MPKTLKLKLE